MPQPIFLVDAFTNGPFSGNPAAVMPLNEEPAASWMQQVAEEMKQAETAFVWPEADRWRIRWFTPSTEVELCGHATLAAAQALWQTGAWSDHAQTFYSLSGPLPVRRSGNEITLDFPAEPGAEHTERGEVWQRVTRILGKEPLWLGRNRMDWLAQTDEATVRDLQPDMTEIERLGMRGLIVTAMDQRGQDYDFVSRFFAPQSGVPEDPVTGSAHCFLGPFWAERWAKSELLGYQASPRGGSVRVVCAGDRCLLTGSATIVVRGEWIGATG